MALRLLEVAVPQAAAEELRAALADKSLPELLSVWEAPLTGESTLFRVLLPAEVTEPVMDLLTQRFSGRAGFRMVILPVEGTVPHPEEPAPPEEEKAERRVGRVSREELYSRLSDAARPTLVYLALSVLSAVVAAVGLRQGSIPAIIGAMVIAPFLGPNVGLALATALADFTLARRAVRSFGAGLALSFGVALIAGRVGGIDPTLPALAPILRVGWGDLLLAVASGVAGVLAFTTGLSEALIGVMVAVALLPPWVTCGMLVGAGEYHLSARALVLFLTNVISINLAGVAIFLIQGVHPLSWWEERRARRASGVAILVWSALVVILVLVILHTR